MPVTEQFYFIFIKFYVLIAIMIAIIDNHKIISTAMHVATITPHVAGLAEHSQLRDENWFILGIATATEHSVIDATAATEHNHRVVRLGYVKICCNAFNEPITRTMDDVQH